MNYRETLKWLYAQLPMFHRLGAAAYKDNLDNTIAICSLLQNPERKFKSIHIAGTNGKGSCSHYLASIFQNAGYKTGLYTSPHLLDFRERIKINGKLISKKKVSHFVEKHQDAFQSIKPSFFEWTVGLAFQHFAEEKVDIAIIETGLGGRLDSTNVIHPLLSIITNISFDHQNLLGHTLAQIAGEKAGIIKKNVPILIGESNPALVQIWEKKSKILHSPVYYSQNMFVHKKEKYNPHKNYSEHTFQRKNKSITIYSDLTGIYQKFNLPIVLSAIELLKKDFHFSEESISKGTSSVISSTGLFGRWQLISKAPRIIADTGHNKAGLEQLVEGIRRERKQGIFKGKLHFVFGVVNDKARTPMFQAIAQDSLIKKAEFYFCKPGIPRGLSAHVLQKEASSFHLSGGRYRSVKIAVLKAIAIARRDDLILIGGSTFVVADALKMKMKRQI